MILIVTGPDGAGKSTLVRGLQERLHLTVCHASHDDAVARDQQSLGQYMEGFCYGRRRLVQSTIWDRWYYPEDILYGNIVEDRSSVLQKMRGDIEAELIRQHAAFIVLGAAAVTLKYRLAQKGEDYVPFRCLPELLQAYRVFSWTCVVPRLYIDTTRRHPENILASVLRSIRQLGDLTGARLQPTSRFTRGG